MKQQLITTLLVLIPIINYAQAQESPGGFGFGINSSVNGELYPVQILPGVIYFKGNNQFELGFGFNPFTRQTQKLLCSELNYKYFPNGYDKKFNLFLITRISYVNNQRNTYYPTTYNYLFLNGGYGFEIKLYKNMFLGTNISLGAFTFHKNSESPHKAFQSQNLFDKTGLNLAFQINVGYRF